jgi:hypothetical protein
MLGGEILMSREKGRKLINNRLKMVSEETLDILYGKLPLICRGCCFNCDCTETIGMKDSDNCINYKQAYELNEIVEMLKEANVNLERLAKNYGLKIKYLRKMLKGEQLLPWKYYSVVMDTLLEKNEFLEYESRFTENEIENNAPQMEGNI